MVVMVQTQTYPQTYHAAGQLETEGFRWPFCLVDGVVVGRGAFVGDDTAPV